MMFWWHLNRSLAIARHEFLWRLFERSDPLKWPPHMDAIKLVYGY